MKKEKYFVPQFNAANVANHRLWIFDLYGALLTDEGQIINQKAIFALMKHFIAAGGDILFISDRGDVQYDGAVFRLAQKMQDAGILDESLTLGAGRLPSPPFLGLAHHVNILKRIDELFLTRRFGNKPRLPFSVSLGDGKSHINLLKMTETNKLFSLEIRTNKDFSHENYFSIDLTEASCGIEKGCFFELVYYLTANDLRPWFTSHTGVNFLPNGNTPVRLTETMLIGQDKARLEEFKSYAGRGVHVYSRQLKRKLSNEMKEGIDRSDWHRSSLTQKDLRQGQNTATGRIEFDDKCRKAVLTDKGRVNTYLETLYRDLNELQREKGLDTEALTLDEVHLLEDTKADLMQAESKSGCCLY